MFSSRYFSKRYFTGAYFPPAANDNLTALFEGTSSFSATITNTGVEQQPVLNLGNLGFNQQFWPQSESNSPEPKVKIANIAARFEGASEFKADGYVSKQTPIYDIVKQIVRKYEAEIEYQREEDDEESLLALMSW